MICSGYSFRFHVVWIVFAIWLFSFDMDSSFVQEDPGSLGNHPSALPRSVSDTALASFQSGLLDLAFDIATSIPIDPHIKDRSRAQEIVVAVCLQLNQPTRAAAYTEQIENWRRGMCYADLAFYYGKRGDRETAQYFLNRAESASNLTDEWRKDRIRVRIGQTYLVLGEAGKADGYEKGVVDSERGILAGVRAMVCSDDSFDARMKELDELIASGQYDILANALKSCAQLFHRFYTDPKRRAIVEEKIEQSWNPLPIIVRIELLMEMAEFALDRSDPPKALALIDKAQAIVDRCEWPLEHRISLLAKLAVYRFRAGDPQKARLDIGHARSLLTEQSNSIVDIYRAGAFRSIAQAYQVIGDGQTSLSLYKQAVDEGVTNPNSRPRAEDLSATCASMAQYAVEPDSQLWTRIHQIREELGQPW